MDSEPSREEVERVRALKKGRDALRKLESKLKKAEGDAAVKLQTERDDLVKTIAQLEAAAAAAPAAASAAAAPAVSSSATAAATKAPVSAATAETAASNTLMSAEALVAEIKQCQQLLGTAPAGDVAAIAARLGVVAAALAKLPAAAPTTATAAVATPSASPARTAARVRSHPAVAAVPADAAPTPEIYHSFADLAIRTRLLQVVGGNARALALVDAMSEYIRTAPLLRSDSRSAAVKDQLLQALGENIRFVAEARPLCQSMTFVVSTFSRRVFDETRMAGTLQENLLNIIADIGLEVVESVRKLASFDGEVAEGDTILTFGRSSAVESLLCGAAAKRQFKVIVLDSDLNEGKGLVQRLQARGVETAYALCSAVCQVLPQATKVFLGSSAVMQSGAVVNRCGTALVAACAKQFRKPVFVFAEGHKMTADVWMGSMTKNEAAGRALTPGAGLAAFHERIFGATSPTGHLYDVTPPELIDVMVTSAGRIHPTAIAALMLLDEEDN